MDEKCCEVACGSKAANDLVNLANPGKTGLTSPRWDLGRQGKSGEHQQCVFDGRGCGVYVGHWFFFKTRDGGTSTYWHKSYIPDMTKDCADPNAPVPAPAPGPMYKESILQTKNANTNVAPFGFSCPTGYDFITRNNECHDATVALKYTKDGKSERYNEGHYGVDCLDHANQNTNAVYPSQIARVCYGGQKKHSSQAKCGYKQRNMHFLCKKNEGWNMHPAWFGLSSAGLATQSVTGKSQNEARAICNGMPTCWGIFEMATANSWKFFTRQSQMANPLETTWYRDTKWLGTGCCRPECRAAWGLASDFCAKNIQTRWWAE
jgi:hypothetical protein